MSAAPALGDETFLLEGIKDDRDPHLGAVLIGDGDAELWVAVGEIGGTVERIDNPSMIALMVIGAALFSQQCVGRKGPLKNLNHARLGLLIGFGDEVDGIGLAGHAGAAEPFQMYPCGRSCRPEGHFMRFAAVSHSKANYARRSTHSSVMKLNM